MKLTPYTKAALAALCLGLGVALFASAVAEASAELIGEPDGDD